MHHIFVLPDPEVEALLQDNQVNLVSELAKQGLSLEHGFEVDPTKDPGGRDVALVLLASSALVGAIGMAVSQIIAALSRRPVLVDHVSCQAIRDKNGTLVTGNDGRPVFEWVQSSELLEGPSRKESSSLHASLGGARGLQLRLSREG
jgi:hypothetical protein